jgi:hypothetical protein
MSKKVEAIENFCLKNPRLAALWQALALSALNLRIRLASQAIEKLSGREVAATSVKNRQRLESEIAEAKRLLSVGLSSEDKDDLALGARSLGVDEICNRYV